MDITILKRQIPTCKIPTYRLNAIRIKKFGNTSTRYQTTAVTPSENCIIATYKGTGDIKIVDFEEFDMSQVIGMTVNGVETTVSNNVITGTGTSNDVVKFTFGNLTSTYRMFYGCEKLISLDLSSLDTSNVIDMSYMFYYCTGLTSLDLSSFNTRKVRNMELMFNYCEKLTSLDLSSFDTSNVTDMSYMFYNCESLTSLDLSSFDTSNVTNMMGVFFSCTDLISLNLSSFNTSNVTNMKYMFNDCACNVICRNQEEADKYLALNSSLTVTIK